MTSHIYRDPAAIWERREEWEIGCRGCAGWTKDKRGRAKCDMERPEFPEADKHTCKWWRQRSEQ